jgi:glutathione peroxidase
MRKSVVALAALMLVSVLSWSVRSDDKGDSKVPPALNFKMKKLDGKEVNLADYKGKVVLFVNVASQCGYTPQYKGLAELHEKFGKSGLAIIGVPANEFGKQEPGTDKEIAQFCEKNYGVKFDMLSKVVVKGEGQCPLYKYLTSKDTNPKFAGDVKWNFEKFLIGRDGEIVGRYKSAVEPMSEELVGDIEKALAAK